MESPHESSCFHCGLPVPQDSRLEVKIDDILQPMCCPGCTAVAQAIVDNGLADFYRYRTENAPTGQNLVPEFLRRAQAYDHAEIQKTFVRVDQDDTREASLILEGITCAACIWLNEQHLATLPGVLDVKINYATHRARVRWDNEQIALSRILEAVHQIGYVAHPYDPSHQERLLENERRGLLKRLGIAGVFGMQVMVLAVAMYSGDWYGMESEYRKFFSGVSLALTTPILLYSAQPFFRAAWRDLKRFHAGMNVPVSLGITIAFAGSAWATWRGQGHVYYDSVAMFVFFLLAARYLELLARKRASEASQSLVHAVPAVALRLTLVDNFEQQESVTVTELKIGDRVLIPPGESIPADGCVIEGRSNVDESLLTGESLPIAKRSGDTLVGGSINIESPLVMRIEQIGNETVLAAIMRLLDRAQTEKPALAMLADRTAARFVLAILVLATGVAFYWWQVAPDRWLAITISMLVVTCPCALSLATPTSLTAATGGLTRMGLLVTRGHTLETLARVTHFVFDKTGTLTRGQMRLLKLHTLGDQSVSRLLKIAVSLEARSEHPIALAIRDAGSDSDPNQVTDVMNTPGGGISATIDSQPWYLGSASFVATQSGRAIDADTLGQLQASGHTVVWLANVTGVQGAFEIGDETRPGAAALVSSLQQQGKHVLLLTGDHQHAAQTLAAELHIQDVGWDQTPDSKLEKVKALQDKGAIVAMVGDGVNDAPVLSGAHVSIAMGSAAHIAAANADMLLLSQQLNHIANADRVARKTLVVIRQNLVWALLYNAMALPLAATGYIAPWMAAIGMSASSLLVTGNALRLTRKKLYM
ncbi:MAG: heavy metal translocating P-type ATPase [Acidiferrobacterales bacterium]